MSAIASFCAFTRASGASLTAPRVERPATPSRSTAEFIADVQAVELLAVADRINPRSAALIRLLMLDGLKVGELVRADADDIAGRPPRMTLTLREPPAVIELHIDTAAAVRAYLGRRRRGPLLLSERRARESDRLTRFGIDYIIKQAAAAAGLSEGLSGNTLRRHYVITAHQRGDAIADIQRHTGHADKRTTRRYLSPTSVSQTGRPSRS